MTHQDYIFYSYALTFLGIGGLILWSIIRALKAKRDLIALETKQ